MAEAVAAQILKAARTPLVAQGATDAQLYISVRTVRSHLDHIRDKTGCRRADLTRLALTAGLIQPEEYGTVRIAALRELEQFAELNLRLDLGPTGLPEPELAAGQRILPGVQPRMPPPARQLLYVTGRTKAAAAKQRIRSVHEPVTNRPVKA
jgi:hypothetical protein